MRRFLCLVMGCCFLLAPTSASAQTSSANPGSDQTTWTTTASGHWTGYWTWDSHKQQWFWTWVWVPSNGGPPYVPSATADRP